MTDFHDFGPRPARRVQLKRSKGWRKPKETVSVCRPTRWGNPYKVGDQGCATRANAVAKYDAWIRKAEQSKLRKAMQRELRGKNLGCWCPLNEPCHADTILIIANAPDESDRET